MVSHRFFPLNILLRGAFLSFPLAFFITSGISGSPASSARAASTPIPPPPVIQNQPELGLLYTNLSLATTGPCQGFFQIANTNLCTHGPDPLPPGVSISSRPDPVAAETITGVECSGDGNSGYRVQVIYAHASDVPDQYNTYLASFQAWAADADDIFNDSAAETGGARHIRFVHDNNCDPLVLNVTLSPSGDDTISNTINELWDMGFNDIDRKYMIFVDANIYCGVGTIYRDDRPGEVNINNLGPDYGRIDASCWGHGWTAAHELMHNLGGVQLSAPHASGGWHCTDEYDRMCYSDYPYYPAMVYLCPVSSHNRLFDCNHDDYYHTAPSDGSYLATHWNTADNLFLIGSPLTYCMGLEATILGTPKKDNLSGTEGDDVILGLGGRDHIDGRGGDDVICGGSGKDRISGGEGNDQIDGGGDKDTLNGQAGDDQLHGQDGNDKLIGGEGNDDLAGGAGNDKLEGGDNQDNLNGGDGKDKLKAGAGMDTLQGGAGDDRLEGGDDDDSLDGGDGLDTLIGGDGTDTCSNGEKLKTCEA